jgi:hypothetical protein
MTSQKNKKVKLIRMFVILLALLSAVVLFIFIQQSKGRQTESAGVQNGLSDSGEIKRVGEEKGYRSTHFGFTFRVPEGFTIGEFDEGGGRVVLVNTGDGESAFQIFISPYDEGAQSLTVERIQEDVPNLTIREPETLQMTGGQSVLTFVGEDDVFGVKREVWMVHKGNLFQIMATVEKQEELARILETWELF